MRYRRLQGNTSYLPYAARTGLRKRQRRRARLLYLGGVLVLALAAVLFLRDSIWQGGQPVPPAATASPTAAPTAPGPANVVVQLATIDITRDVLADLEQADTAARATPGSETTAMPSAVEEVLPQYRELYATNPDLVGWLRIEGTDIDYPVMRTPEDNNYYLRRGFDRFYATGGTLFMDNRCRPWAEGGASVTANWMVYGHNMSNGSMFGTLDRYADEEFYREHPTFTFDTLYEESEWRVAAVLYTTLGAENLPYYAFFDAVTATEWQIWMDAILPLALYDTGVVPQYGDQLLTLSTCGDHTPNTDSRFAVLAVRSQNS